MVFSSCWILISRAFFAVVLDVGWDRFSRLGSSFGPSVIHLQGGGELVVARFSNCKFDRVFENAFIVRPIGAGTMDVCVLSRATEKRRAGRRVLAIGLVAAVLATRPCLLEAQHLRAAGLMAYIPRNSLTKSNRAWDLGDKKPTEVSPLQGRTALEGKAAATVFGCFGLDLHLLCTCTG